MSTIKSSSEHLTLNADGSGNDVIIQSDGSTKAIVTAEGDVGIGTTTPAQKLSLNTGYVQVGNGIGGAGGVKYPYSAANADCRNWRTRSDMVAYGDWGIEQSTTQSGETYSNKLRVSQAGDVIVGTGDLIFGTAGKGIVLGSTTNVDANTLDDYEEGTWTPTIVGYSGGTTQTYSAQTGKYTKIGDMVYAAFRLVLSSKGNISGNYTLISGLPFNHNTADGGSTIISTFSGLTSATTWVGGDLSSTANWVWLTRGANGTSSGNVNTSEINNTTSFTGSVVYRI